MSRLEPSAGFAPSSGNAQALLPAKSKAARKHWLGVRLPNGALNVVLLSVCLYYILDYLYPAPVSRLLSSLAAQPDDSRYADVARNTHEQRLPTCRWQSCASIWEATL